jgi:CheY-like chemotaxis protein
LEDFKILIVEDEFLVAADIKHNLESVGYDVVGIASTGKDAINNAGKLFPDIILMDITLKGDMDGIDAAQQIRNLYDIPIVYLTGFFDDGIIERAKITQPYGYIVKPFTGTGLLSIIKMACYNHQKMQKLELRSKILRRAKEDLSHC